MSEILHASAVAVAGRGVLILGASGAGKSVLAAELISRGATLIADDQVVAGPDLSAPPKTAGLIELRGIGLLRLPSTRAPLSLIADLDQRAPERLPEPLYRDLLGGPVRTILLAGHPAPAAAILTVLAGTGPLDPETPISEL
ncbi:MAG: HPr kinase/phosphatase C-terminal domain-containing protein [Pseudomonadota bacterium]